MKEDDGAFERSLFASIDYTPIATVITNPRLDDNPIVALNHAFTELTGYAPEEAIGRNCRFLSRTEDSEGRRALRNAVALRAPILVEIANYKKDGTPFRNAVMVAPIFLRDGELGYFVGSQMDVDASAGAAVHRSGVAVDRVNSLTPRQRQVLDGMVSGKLNKQIAVDLGIGEKTVKMHRSALFRRLGVRVSAEAIRLGLEAGIDS